MRVELRIKPYIQPFERTLAFQEVTALAHARPRPKEGSIETATEFTLQTTVKAKLLIERLAYWEFVGVNRAVPTMQLLAEATSTVVRNGIPLKEIKRQLPFREVPVPPNRRCLRYGTHGIHEYRGKFFPQLVRALTNTAQVPTAGLVADPMCGSGTTLVEAVMGGFTGLGADINPLSVLMARTKCALLRESPDHIARSYERIRAVLLDQPKSPTTDLAYFHTLPATDQGYLTKWFSEQVLRDLDRIVLAIQDERRSVVRDFFTLALSNILRQVSWQKLDDLRVRRDFRPDADIDPVKEFLEEIGRSVRSVLALRHQMGRAASGKVIIAEESATTITRTWNDYVGKVDAIITSPPYATALPYLDTDRLSLSYLRLLSRPMHRRRDEMMIGNREVTERTRRLHWEQYLASRSTLPRSVVQLVDRIECLNSAAVVGFRRRNLSALLSRYFLDMRDVLSGMISLLKKGRPAYVVVGNNSTTAGHEHISIETGTLLSDLAESVGFDVDEPIPMEMLVSRDIFRRNAMASETILRLRRR